MYYLLYGMLYLVSLLPLPVLYLFGDGCYALVYYVLGYRRKVVLKNLAIAFPEKTEKERVRIAKDFFHIFIDTFIETIKMLSISEAGFNKRVEIDLTAVNAMAARGKNIQIYACHQMNWEFFNWAVIKQIKVPWIGIYMTLSNKALEKIFYKLRSKFGTILVPAQQFKSMMHNVFKSQYALGLGADQNPGHPAAGLWLNFFGQPVPFVTGPSRSAIKNNLGAFYIQTIKVKRGYYRFKVIPMFENGSEHTQAEIIRLYRNLIEKTIQENPSNYLWSHRRWKWEYQPEYRELWVDETPPQGIN